MLKFNQLSKKISVSSINLSKLMKNNSNIHTIKSFDKVLLKTFCNVTNNSKHYLNQDKEKEQLDTNDLEDEALNYDFFDQKYIHNSTNDFSKFVNKMKCQGCGINLQIF